MTITFVQSTTGAGNLALGSVGAGNTLFYIGSYHRNPSTGAKEATPTDSAGTLLAASNDPPLVDAGLDIGVSVFYETSAAAGTHTVTPQGNTIHHGTLVEFSGLVSLNILDTATSATDSTASHLTQPTGTTAVTAQNTELSLIAVAILQNTGGNPVGLTNPVGGYTTLLIDQDTATDIGAMHSYKILSLTGAQSTSFTWTTVDASVCGTMGCIATFKGVEGTIPSTGAYQQEQNTTDRYQLEDGTGVYLIEPWGQTGVFLPPFMQGDLTGIGTPGRYFKDRLN